MCGGRYLSSPLLPPPPRPSHTPPAPQPSAALCTLGAYRRGVLPPRFTAFRETKRFMKRKAVLRAGIIMLY